MRSGRKIVAASSLKTCRGFRRSVLVLTAAVALGLTAMPAKADRHCEPTATERLNRLNVDPADVRKIVWVEIHKGMGGDVVVERIDAWVSLYSCEGHVIIEITPWCYVRQIWGKGECASVVP